MSRPALIFLLLSLVLFATGCRQTPASSDQLAGRITVAGSTSVQPISEVLAEQFAALHPHLTISVQGGGSSAGIRATKEGVADVGTSSRELNEDEKQGLHETIIARDGIAVIVHPSNPVRDLTPEQIRAIFAGAVTNWEKVNGNHRTVVVVTREAGSGTRGAFEEMIMGKQDITDRAIVLNSTGAVQAAVSDQVDAIGYVSLASLSPDVSAVTVAGIQISIENIQNGAYRLARPFIYLTQVIPSAPVKAFLEFVQSPAGQAIVAENGLVPVR